MFSIYIFLCNFTAACLTISANTFFLPLSCKCKLLLSKMGLESKSYVIKTSKFDATKSHIKEVQSDPAFSFLLSNYSS